MPGYAITIDAGIAHLVLTRPNAGNALSAGFWKGLAPDIGALDRTGDVRAMVLSSEGPIFCAGMDLGEFAGGIPENPSRTGSEGDGFPGPDAKRGRRGPSRFRRRYCGYVFRRRRTGICSRPASARKGTGRHSRHQGRPAMGARSFRFGCAGMVSTNTVGAVEHARYLLFAERKESADCA